MKKPILLLTLIFTVLITASCKRTKDTFTSRLYHSTVSKFNPLFNGEQALLKAENTIQQTHKDNFDEILPVYKLGNEQTISNVKPDLEKAIEKGSKVIQQHSMMIRNAQKNKYIDDSYLLIGIARYYQKDYPKALETFNYIIQEYPNSKIIYEARLWAARCKVQIENYLAAESDFEELYRESEVPKKLKDDVLASYAQMKINTAEYFAAFQLLDQAIDKTKDKQNKVRWLFITGQLHSKVGNDFEASEIFKEVIKMGPPYELLFQAQLNRARNYDIELQDPQRAFAELNSMLKDDKNYDNRDQIYYVMAELAEKMDDEAAMLDYLKKSVRVSTNNQKQKALSYLKLAEINFRNKLYTTAEAYYDSTFTNLDQNDPRYKQIEKTKISLGNLVKNLEVISTQDSLQHLATLSESERLRIIDEYIFDLQRAEEEKNQQETNNNNFPLVNNNGSTQEGMSTGGTWYFYNPTVRAMGLTDFTNRFGNRKLEDNWRRKNKQAVTDFNTGGGTEEELEGGDNVEASAESGASGMIKGEYNRDTYLANIPLTQVAMKESHEKIMEAFMNLGRIYKDDLKDLDAAANSLEELLKRYPEMEERGRVWYTLYRIYLTSKKEQKANHYKNLVLTKLPDSDYAALIHSAESGSPLASKNEVAEFYKSAYQKFENREYKASLKLTEEGISKYQQSSYAPKFYLLKAFSLGRQGNKEQLITNLKLIVDQFSETEEAQEARDILAQLEEKPKENSTTEASKTATPYQLKSKNVQHKYVVVVPNQGAKVNALRIELTDFNSKFFNVDNLNTKSVLLGMEKQIILVSNFNNAQRAMDYYKTVQNQKVIEKQFEGGTAKHFVISSDNFQKFYGAKDADEYLEFFKNNYLNQ